MTDTTQNWLNFAPSNNPSLPQEPQPAPTPDPVEVPQAPSVADRMKAAGDRLAARRLDRMLESVSIGIKTNPDDYAEAVKIGKQLNVDPSVVAENKDVLREVARTRALRQAKLEEVSPVLAASLRSVDFAKIAHDDIENLSFVEKTIRSWKAGLLQFETGDLAFKVMNGTATKEERERYSQVRQQSTKTPPGEGLWYGFITQMGLYSRIAPEIIATGAATALPVGIAAQSTGPLSPITTPISTAGAFAFGSIAQTMLSSARIESGLDYQDFLDQGLETNAAYWAASLSGSVKGILEGAGDYVFAAPFRGMLNAAIKEGVQQAFAVPTMSALLKTASKESLVNITANTLEESAQELVKLFIQKRAKAKSDPNLIQDEWADIWPKVAEAASQAFQASVIPGVFGPSIKFSVDKRAADRAIERSEAVQELVDNIKGAKLAKRDAGVLSEFVGKVASSGGGDRVFFNAKDLKDAFETAGVSLRQIEEELPEIASQWTTTDNGGDIVVSMGTVAKMALNDKVSDAIAPHMRESAEAMSAFQAQEFKKLERAAMSEAKVRAEQRMAEDKAFRESASKVEKAIIEQMEPLQTQATPTEVRQFAGMVRLLYSVYAEKSGDLPFDAYQKNPFKIAGKAPEGAQAGLAQVDDAERASWAESLRSSADKESNSPTAVRPSPLPIGSVHEVDSSGEFIYRGMDDPRQEIPSKRLTFSVGNRWSFPFMVEFHFPGWENEASAGHNGVQAKVRPDSATRILVDVNGYDWNDASFGMVRDAMALYRNAELSWVSVEERSGGDVVTVVDAPSGWDGSLKSTASGTVKGEYFGGINTAVFYKKANFSTLVHELGHHYRKMLFSAAAASDGPTLFAEDANVLLKQWGLSSIKEFEALDQKQKVKFEEQFARWFEKWLSEGKAPSVELESLFRRFKNWLKRIYTDVIGRLNADYKAETGEDLPVLTDEVRGVFERMLATDIEIQRARAVRGEIDMLEFAAMAQKVGLDTESEEWNVLRLLAAEDMEKAIDLLNSESVKDMQWLHNASIAETKKLQAQHDAIRAKVRDEVEQKLASTPLFRAVRDIQQGKAKADDGTEIEHRLDRDEVENILSAMLSRDVVGDPGKNLKTDAKKMARRMERAREKLGFGKAGGMVVKDGQNPELIAQQHGFASAEQMIRALINAPDDLNTLIDQFTDEAMLERYSELADPKKRQEKVNEALANEAHSRFVAARLNFLRRVRMPESQVRGAAKAAAMRALSETRVSDIDARAYRSAESRAAANAMRALKEGNLEDAIIYTYQELVQAEMGRLAVGFRKDIKAAEKLFKNFAKQDKKLAKSRNIDFIIGGRIILAAVGKHPTIDGQAREKWLAEMKEEQPEFYRSFSDMLTYASEVGTKSVGNANNLTLDEFMELRDYAKSLWETSYRMKKYELDGKEVELDALIGMFKAALEKMTPDDVEAVVRPLTEKQKDAIKFNDTATNLALVLNVCQYLDGGQEGGLFTRAIYRKMRNALDEGRKVAKEMLKPLTEQFDPIAKTLKHDAITFDTAAITLNSEAEALGFVLQAGTVSSSERAALYPVLTKDGVVTPLGSIMPDGTVDTSKVLKLIQEMADKGILTRERMDMIQSVWDTMEAIDPLSQAAHKKIHGFKYEKLEARPLRIRFKDGTVVMYRGGYMPAKYDPYLDSQTSQAETLQDLAASAQNTRAQVPSGFTKKRALKVSKPLRFDISVAVHHIEEAVRYAHVEPVVHDLLKVFRNKEFVNAMKLAAPSLLDKLFMPWLNRSARQITSVASNSRWLDEKLHAFRVNSGMNIMFGNIVNSSQQVTGLPITAAEIGWRRLFSGLRQVVDPETWKFVRENSLTMTNRFDPGIRILAEEMQHANKSKTALRAFQRFSRRHPYWLQTLIQMPIDVAAWKGSYDKHLADLLNGGMAHAEAHKEAAQRADEAVIKTQGSRNPEDVANYEQATELVKVLTQFSGWSNMLGNNNFWKMRTLYRQLGWKGTVPKMAYHYLMTMLVPGIIGAAIVNFLGGRGFVPPDEDDDGYFDELAFDYLFMSQIRLLTSMVPGIGSAGMALVGAFTDKPYDDRVLQAPAITTFEQGARSLAMLTRAMTDENFDLRGTDIKNLLGAVGTAYGIPTLFVAKPLGYLTDVSRGVVDPEGPWDFIRGFITGTASPESKR